MQVKPLSKNFLIYQGSTFIINFNWSVASYPLTDKCVADMEIRSSIESDVSLLHASTSNNMITINPEIGRIELKIPANVTAQMNFQKAVYDIELEFENGDRFRIVQGAITVNPEVTRV